MLKVTCSFSVGNKNYSAYQNVLAADVRVVCATKVADAVQYALSRHVQVIIIVASETQMRHVITDRSVLHKPRPRVPKSMHTARVIDL